jgi:hypothetical protein
MDNKELIRKLTSRKFWVLLIALVSAVLAFLKFDKGSIEQITTIIMAFGAMISYVLGESYVDGKRVEGDVTNIINTEKLKKE